MNVWVGRNRGNQECDECLSRVRGRLVFTLDDNKKCCRRCFEEFVWDSDDEDDFLDLEDES